MSEVKPAGTNLFNTYQSMFLEHQKFFPYANLASRYAQAARSIMEAQVNYAQALMRAQAMLLGANLEQAEAGAEMRPSEAAQRPEYMSA